MWKMEISVNVRRAHAINLLLLYVAFLVLSSLVFADASITLNSPANRNLTNVTTPSFNITVVGNHSQYNCSLYIRNVSKGNNETVFNNTATIITSSSLPGGTYEWYVNCTNGTITNQSATRILFRLNISSTTNLTILNWSGNLTKLRISYHHSSTNITGNISVVMDDLDGECNYGTSNVSNQSNTIRDILFPRNVSSLTNCTPVVLTANNTNGTFSAWIQEDEEVSRGNLASIIASAAVAITTILHALSWDSHTQQ